MADSLGTLKFGAHKGKDIEDVPTSYLTYLVGEQWFLQKNPTLAENIRKELKFRKQFTPERGSAWDVPLGEGL